MKNNIKCNVGDLFVSEGYVEYIFKIEEIYVPELKQKCAWVHTMALARIENSQWKDYRYNLNPGETVYSLFDRDFWKYYPVDGE